MSIAKQPDLQQANKKKKVYELRNAPWIGLGLFVIFVLFGGGGIWASHTQISGAIIAQGTVGVASKIRKVQHLDGGIVLEILVGDGDEVKAGDHLLHLDESGLRANLNIKKNNLYELLARKARLDTEQENADKITFPDVLKSNKTIPHVQRIIDSKTVMFESRRKTRSGQRGMMRQKIISHKDQIQGLEAQIRSKEQQVQIVAKNIKKKEPAATSGIVSQDSLDKLKLQHVALIGEVGELRANIARIGSTIAEVELEILQIEVDFREKVQEELRSVTTQIAEFEEQKIALEEKLRRTWVTAPVSGRVLEMSIHTIGGVIGPADTILQIIPKNDSMIIEAKIHTTDVDQVHIGQETSVHLSAFDARTTPNLKAKVNKISAGQLIDATTNTPYFAVELAISKNQLLLLNKNQILLPGMPAEIFIQTENRTPLDYLLKPLMAQFKRAFKEQ